MRILLAVDESENSHRVVQYVGSLLGRTPDVVITLFHVLKPMPRGLLEHGGSENPAAEAQLGVQLRDEQEAWIRKERESECHVLKEACETLCDACVSFSGSSGSRALVQPRRPKERPDRAARGDQQ